MSRGMCLCAMARSLGCEGRIGGPPAETYMQARSNSFHLAASLASALALAALVGCAAGAEGTGSDDDPIDARRVDGAVIDGPNNPQPDAPVSQPDARLVDAPVSQPDAPIGLPDGGITGACTTHAECGAGSCCFGMLMCVPGDPLPLPPPFDCLPS